MGGAAAAAIAVVVIAIVLSGSNGGSVAKPESASAKAAARHVDSLLAGIPQSGETLGKSSAPITITEYDDLECSACDVLATPASFKNPEGEACSGWEDELINQYVRSGKAKLVYKSLETASSENPDSNAFEQQQVAAYAAGLMYNEQGQEDTGYVTQNYLEGLAKQIPGLNFKEWISDRSLASLKREVTLDNQEGATVDGGEASTPTAIITGPKGQSQPIVGLPNSGYSAYAAAIKSVA